MTTHFSVLAWRIPMDRGAWWATVHGVAKSQTQLSDQAQTVAHQAPPSMGFPRRILEWVTISFSGRSSQPRDHLRLLFVRWITTEPPGKPTWLMRNPYLSPHYVHRFLNRLEYIYNISSSFTVIVSYFIICVIPESIYIG